MKGRSLLLGILLLVLVSISTEGRKGRKRARLRGLMMADDPEPVVTAVEPITKVGQCSCKCCEDKPAPYTAPPCASDVIIAVDGSACFRDQHRRMLTFLQKLASQFHKSGDDTKFGINKTRLGILQFSSENVLALPLNEYDASEDLSSKTIRNNIYDHIDEMQFLGEGAFLNKALNATVLEFMAHPRPDDIVQEITRQGGQVRKVVIAVTNGKSHPDVTEEDLDYSVQFLRDNGVVILPVSVTRRCYGVASADWDEGLCPDQEVMSKLSELNNWDDDYLAMKAVGTAAAVVKEATNCDFTPPQRLTASELCNNCTCDCDLPVGPKGDQGKTGPKGDSIQGPEGEVGPKGDKGELGPQGDEGEIGEPGEKGEVGPKGAKGEVGSVGPKGDQGVEGPEGEKGDTGEKGDQGAKGDTGEEGDVGPKGDTGEKGDTGIEGPKGSKGEDGERGEDGPKGEPGRNGLGIKGDEGERGPKGIQGVDGAEGPPGEKGMKGMQGLCGKPGPPGPQGEPGLAGVDGQDGMTGQPGSQGPRGPEGLAGEKGEPGISGAQGIIGPAGLEGPPGPAGAQGEPGQRGFVGRDSDVPGPSGPQGPKGDRGAGGSDGLEGTQGYPGERGPRGYTGPKGDEGRVDAATLRPIIAEIIRELLPGDCASPTPPPEKNDTLIECYEVPVDLLFLIDGSDSITREEFVQVERWILRLVDRFNPSDREETIHLDVVQYSSSVENSVHALVADSSEEVRPLLEGIVQLREGSKAYKGLAFVNSNVSLNMREGSHKILITTSDGDPSDERDQEQIDTARAKFDTMIVVGIGDSFNETVMMDFADADQPIIVKVDDFSTLETNIDTIVQKSCYEILRASEEAAQDSRRRKRNVADRPHRHNHKKRSARPKPVLIQE